MRNRILCYLASLIVGVCALVYAMESIATHTHDAAGILSLQNALSFAMASTLFAGIFLPWLFSHWKRIDVIVAETLAFGPVAAIILLR